MRQIRGRAPVDPSTLPIARHVAELLRRQRSFTALFLALAMVLVGMALPHDDPFRWWMVIFVTAVYATLIPLIYRESARAERFLAQYRNELGAMDPTPGTWPVP